MPLKIINYVFYEHTGQYINSKSAARLAIINIPSNRTTTTINSDLYLNVFSHTRRTSGENRFHF